MSTYSTQLDFGERSLDDGQLRIALIDSVTHEFRTPLTSIKAAVTTLLAEPRLRASQRNELLSVIDEEADRLNRLVGVAVEASRLDARVKLDLAPLTIAAIVNAAKGDCRTLFAGRTLSLRLEP